VKSDYQRKISTFHMLPGFFETGIQPNRELADLLSPCSGRALADGLGSDIVWYDLDFYLFSLSLLKKGEGRTNTNQIAK
jgi:hypothetical protein